MNSKSIANILTSHGIKPSFPRIQIYDYLYTKKNHPTVDNIYNGLVSKIPTLSKTTIYNTLNLFIENNLACTINWDESEKRYDMTIKDHSHFRCEICGKIYDVPYNDIVLLPEEYEGFIIKEKHIFLKGICNNCNR